MSDSIEPEEEAEASRPLTEIQIFLIKVASVAGAVFFLMVALMGAAYLFVSSQAEELAFLKGGHAFWDMAEEKLYKLADAPDLPEAKKAKIIEALQKLSDRYRPYIDAVEGPPRK
jgi:hypothetical protein